MKRVFSAENIKADLMIMRNLALAAIRRQKLINRFI
jgi:hypothetical protein